MTEVIAMALGGGSTLQWGVDRGLQHLLLMWVLLRLYRTKRTRSAFRRTSTFVSALTL